MKESKKELGENVNVCRNEHVECLAFYCPECKELSCEKCVKIHHIAHFDQIISIEYYITEKYHEFRDLKEKMEFVRRYTEENEEKVLLERLGGMYDKYIQDVIEHKSKFLQDALTYLHPEFYDPNARFSQEKIKIIEKEIIEGCKKCSLFLKKRTHSGEVAELVEINTLNETMSQILNESKRITNANIDINYVFHPELLHSVFDISLQRPSSADELHTPEGALLPYIDQGVMRIYDLDKGKERNILPKLGGIYKVFPTFCIIKDKLYMSGGLLSDSEDPDDLVQEITLFSEFKRNLDNLQVGRIYHSMLPIAKNLVLLVGGRDSTQCSLSDCLQLNTHTGKWTPLPPLNLEREECALNLFDRRYVYAFWGVNSLYSLDSIEKLDLERGGGWGLVAIHTYNLLDAGGVGGRGYFSFQTSKGGVLLFGRDSLFEFRVHDRELNRLVVSAECSLPSEVGYAKCCPIRYYNKVVCFDVARREVCEYSFQLLYWKNYRP